MFLIKAGTEIVLMCENEKGFHIKPDKSFSFSAIIEELDCGGGKSISYSPQEDEEYEDIATEVPGFPSPQLHIQPPINIIPNPNSGAFQIESNFPLSNIVNLKITNMLGTTVYETQNLTSNSIRFQTSTAGVYFVVITLKDGRLLTQKMMVQW